MKALLTLVVMVVAACGRAPESVGLPCHADAECGGGGITCQQSFPAGYCSKPCATVGSASECDGFSVCGRVNGALLCLQRCAASQGCRLTYACLTVAPSSMACVP